MQEKRLERAFFMTDALVLARKLLGKTLVHETPLGQVRGIITETESYMGVEDKGSHTYGGKRTERTEPMFHIGGTSYVYFIYGMYNCVNITAGAEDVPMAALIRMVEPADEASGEIMLKLRQNDVEARKARREKRREAQTLDLGQADVMRSDERVAGKPLPESAIKNLQKHLADGPGKLCIAMDITKEDNDIDMVTSDKLYVTEGIEVEESRIAAGKRIGIDYAEEAADYLWRFTLI